MENTIVTTLNLEKVCRACLNESEEMHSIFSEFVQEDLESETTILYEILMNISSIRVSINPNDLFMCELEPKGKKYAMY